MPRPAKPPVRVKRAKAEVEKEFEQLREETEAARQTVDLKAEETAQIRAAEIREAVDGVTVEAVVARLSSLGLETSKALAGISGRLTAEVETLAMLREAVALERKELERLHKLDVAASALDQMVADYERQKQQLEAEMAAQRAAWEEETRAAERERKEQEEALRKQRQREIDDYEYKKTLERKKAQDRYDEETRQLEKSNREKQETLERGWQQREAAIKAAEQELARLRQEAEQFPVRLKKEADEAAARATQTAKADYERQIAFLKKDSETEKRLAEMRVKSLEDVVARQASQIAALEKQLDESKRQVQDIAVKAIEGASGARALSHINEIAMEQAKNRMPQG